MVRQAGFFDVEERLRELSAKGDCLERIAALLDFALFRPELEWAVPRRTLTHVSPIPSATVQPCNCYADGTRQRLYSCAVAGREGGGEADVLMRQAGFWRSDPNSKKCADFGRVIPTRKQAGGHFPAPAPPTPLALGPICIRDGFMSGGACLQSKFLPLHRYTFWACGCADRMAGLRGAPLSRFWLLHRYRVGPSWQAKATDQRSQPGAKGQHSSDRVRLMSGSAKAKNAPEGAVRLLTY
jgi:hypothetical protein